MFFWDGTILLLIPAMILAMYAQNKVNSSFKKYSQVRATGGYSGAQVAQMLLDKAGLTDVNVELTSGNLTDHYDPRKKVIRLSRTVHDGHSLAALGVSAHETGHAIQHATGYFPLSLRNSFFPIASFGSRLAMPLFIIGLLFANDIGILMDVGIWLFFFAVLFQVITLPVEFNASTRAVDMLTGTAIITRGEEQGVRSVLNAAALTYVASVAVALSQLVRLLILRGRRR